MISKRRKLIEELEKDKSFFIHSTKDMDVSQAYFQLMGRMTVDGKLYSLMKPYLTHLIAGTQLINKICQSLTTLTNNFFAIRNESSKDMYIKNIRKRQRLCKYAASIKDLESVYYFDFAKDKIKAPRKATKDDVIRALAGLIRQAQKHSII